MIKVPEGYALVGIDALKAWGKYEEVRDACRVSMAPHGIEAQGVRDEVTPHGKVVRVVGHGPQYRPDEHETGVWLDEDGVCVEFEDGYRDCFYVSRLLASTPPAPQADMRIPDAVEHYGGVKSDEELFPTLDCLVQQEPTMHVRLGVDGLEDCGSGDVGAMACYANTEQRPAPQASVVQQDPANVRGRWNIELDGDDLLVCFNDHDKGESCSYQRYVPAQQAKPKPLTNEQREAVFVAANGILEHGAPMSWEHALVDAVEAAHGITKGPQQ